MARVRAARASRGDVCWVALDPVIGTEIQKTLPSGEALVTVKGKRARALGDQLRSIDKARLRGKLDTLVSSELAQIEEALRITLALA